MKSQCLAKTFGPFLKPQSKQKHSQSREIYEGPDLKINLLTLNLVWRSMTANLVKMLSLGVSQSILLYMLGCKLSNSI